MKPRPTTLLRYAVLVLALLIAGYPLVWMLSSALRPGHEVLRAPFALPARPTLENFSGALTAYGFARAYGNSLIVATSSVALTVLIAGPAAYAFARMRFRGREALFLLFLAGMMVPVHVTLVPLNRLLGAGALGLKNTYFALIGPYVGFALPISILILRGAFEGVPVELEDAARLDGCPRRRIFWRIALPLVRPALATVVIFNFLTMWNEFAFALTLINDSRMYTLPLALRAFADEAGMDLGRTAAGLCVAVLPVLLIYALAQRHIIGGLTSGAMKQ